MCASRIAAAVLLLGIVACHEQVMINPNDAPIADARAVDPATGMATEDMIMVAYDGAPVTVTLDASFSRDGDGRITKYLWLSALADPDGGVKRTPPEGQAMDWPADTERVDVTLPQGKWTFSLWAEDEEGLISEPDTITVDVGGADPLTECVDAVVDAVTEPCRMCLCAIESCRPMVIESGCDAACWGLIQCIGANCPDFQAMAAMMDYSCLTTNCMAQYTAATGGGTPMGATPAGACARMCPAECAAMPSM